MLRPSGVGGRVVKGAGYQFLGIATKTVLTIGSTAVLARLLSPSDFGYVAMATVVTEFAALFSSFGFTNVLIQKRTINRLQCDTVFWATLGIGSLIAFGVFLASFFAGLLFADARVSPLLRVMSVIFVLNSLSAVPSTVMARLMLFRAGLWISLSTIILRTVVAIGCALAGMGLWSLVIGSVAGALGHALLAFAWVNYRPRFRFHTPLLKESWRISGGYFGNTALYYVNNNLDLLLVGRQLGAVPLGLYQNARSLTDEIRGRIAVPIEHVLFPAMSSMQADPDGFRRLVLRAGRMMAAVVVPIGFGVSVNARELVQVLYGPQWLQMIPVMSMFGISAALKAGTAIATPLFYATNQVGLAFRNNVVGTALLIGGVLLTMQHGLEAVAVAVAASSLYSLVGFRLAFSLIDLTLRDAASVVGPPFLASAALWVVTYLVRDAGWSTTPGVALAGHILVGATTYLLCLHVLSRQYLQDFKQAGAMLLKRT